MERMQSRWHGAGYPRRATAWCAALLMLNATAAEAKRNTVQLYGTSFTQQEIDAAIAVLRLMRPPAAVLDALDTIRFKALTDAGTPVDNYPQVIARVIILPASGSKAARGRLEFHEVYRSGFDRVKRTCRLHPPRSLDLEGDQARNLKSVIEQTGKELVVAVKFELSETGGCVT
jgi:hypothetical protein